MSDVITITFLGADPVKERYIPCAGKILPFDSDGEGNSPLLEENEEDLEFESKQQVAFFLDHMMGEEDVMSLQKLNVLWQTVACDEIDAKVDLNPHLLPMQRTKILFHSIQKRMPHFLRALERDGVLKINRGGIKKKGRLHKEWHKLQQKKH